jgi:hypothetical protein
MSNGAIVLVADPDRRIRLLLGRSVESRGF